MCIRDRLIYYHGIFDAVAAGKTVPLAGSDCLLMEFQTDVTYEIIYQAVRQMALMRYRPVLAHIERYPCLRAPGRIEELRTVSYTHLDVYKRQIYSIE